MAPALKFPCSCGDRFFTKELMILVFHEYMVWLFCELLNKVTSKADEISKVFENVQKEIRELKKDERQGINATGVDASEKNSAVMCRVKVLEEKNCQS